VNIALCSISRNRCQRHGHGFGRPARIVRYIYWHPL